jgi:glycosyltransferase involved in cell wall biosynthesis
MVNNLVANTSPQPWLSILIPVYNVEPYLQDCLNSVYSQHDTGIEVICVEDCSTDNSLIILQEFAQKNPLKIIQHSHNSGLSQSRNTLIEAATGEYLWFLDSDDAISAGSISKLKKIVAQHHPDIVFCDFFLWREKPNLRHKLRGEGHRKTLAAQPNVLHADADLLFKALYTYGRLHIWSKISKRALWQNGLRFPVGRLMEDMVVTPRLLLQAKTFYYVDETWIAYRQRKGSILATWNPAKFDDTSWANSGVLDLWLAKYPQLSADARFAFSNFCAKSFISVSRHLRKTKVDTRAVRRQHQQAFCENSHTSPQTLKYQYFKRGRFYAYYRFWKHLDP